MSGKLFRGGRKHFARDSLLFAHSLLVAVGSPDLSVLSKKSVRILRLLLDTTCQDIDRARGSGDGEVGRLRSVADEKSAPEKQPQGGDGGQLLPLAALTPNAN